MFIAFVGKVSKYFIIFAGCVGAEAAADRRGGTGQPPPERHPDPADSGAPGTTTATNMISVIFAPGIVGTTDT